MAFIKHRRRKQRDKRNQEIKFLLCINKLPSIIMIYNMLTFNQSQCFCQQIYINLVNVIKQLHKQMTQKEIIKQVLSKCICLDDFQKHASKVMAKQKFYYIQAGSQDQFAKQHNRKSFQKLMLIPRVLISTGNPKTSTKILGKQCLLPFGFAPTAMNQLAHIQGQKIPARLAKQYQITFCLSLLSNTSFSDIQIANANGLRIMQMYISTNWQTTLKTIRLAEKYGFQALAITVDAQVLGVRRKQRQYKFDSSELKFPILQQISSGSSNMGNQRQSYLRNRDLGMTWQTISRIRKTTHLKIIVKGILHHQDARLAKNCCDAIWISNHGGRQLDSIPSPIEVLENIRAHVGKEFQVYVDGGVRTGNDILKALARGANYVFLGRPISYGLTLGEIGLRKVIQILKDQLVRAMVLTGSSSIQDLKPQMVKQQPNL